MTSLELKRTCQRCCGTGEEPGYDGEEDCQACGGNGTKVVGTIDIADLETDHTDIEDKCDDILEQLIE